MAFLAVALLIFIFGTLVRAFRWKIIFENNDYRISIFDSLRILVVGLGLNLFLPATSGDIFKSFFAYKWSGVKEQMLSTSIFDKLIAFGSVAIIGICAAFYSNRLNYAGLSSLIIILALIIIWIPTQSSKSARIHIVCGWLEKLTRRKINFLIVIENMHINKKVLLSAIGLSIIGWFITYLQLYISFIAIGSNVCLVYVFTIAPFLTLIRLFPFAFNGMGADEFAMWYFFKSTGLSLEEVIAAAVLYRIITTIIPGFIGLFVLTKKHKLIVSQG
jgi:uncharacterized protein (TIRG00374 family)